MEVWKAIPGWEGMYEVSDLGQVRSLTRYVPHAKNGQTKYKGRVLKAHNNGDGYYHVSLTRPGCKPHSYNVHTLVLITFIGPAPEGFEACHGLDGSSINALTNLRWDTRQENAFDRRRHREARK